MMDVFAWIERTPLSVFVRESLWAFPALLILHAWSMAMLAGGGAAIGLRVLGVAKGARADLFARFLGVMQAGFWIALVSGVLLLIGYPAKAITNWVFWLKLSCLAGAGWLVIVMARRVLPDEATAPRWARLAAGVSIALWAGGVVAGRLLAYTHHILLAS